MSAVAEPQYLSETTITSYEPTRRAQSITHSAEQLTLSVPYSIMRAEWLRPVLRNLVELLRLPGHWDAQGAAPIRRDVADDVVSFLSRFLDTHSAAPWVVPLADGGLQLEWHRGGLDIEVAFSADDAPEMHVVDLDSETQWELDPLSEAIETVRPLVERLRAHD